MYTTQEQMAKWMLHFMNIKNYNTNTKNLRIVAFNAIFT